MKKRILLVLTAAVLTMSMVACGKNDVENNVEQNTEVSTENTVEENTEDVVVENTENVVAATPTVEVLSNVWATYGEDEKFFAMGGDAMNPVDNAPGAYSLDDKEAVSAMFQIPVEAVELTDEAASLIHAMNANTFTGAAFHLTDAANAESFANSAKEGIMNAQWMCGFPEKMVIITVNGEYVISAFGNGEVVDNFKNKVTTVYGENAVILVEENIQ